MSLRVPPIEGPHAVRLERPEPSATTAVEGRVLAARAPRTRRAAAPAGQNRRRQEGLDPPGAKVLLLLIPEGARVPADIGTGEYRVFVRFARKT